jgi:hypothetical protein
VHIAEPAEHTVRLHRVTYYLLLVPRGKSRHLSCPRGYGAPPKQNPRPADNVDLSLSPGGWLFQVWPAAAGRPPATPCDRKAPNAMPLKKPMLALSIVDEDEDDDDDDDDESDDDVEVTTGSGSGGLRKNLGGLSLSMPGDEDDDGYDDESPPGGKRPRGQKKEKKKKDNDGAYEVSETGTFEMGDIRLKKEGLISTPRGRGPNQMKTSFNLREDLDKIKILGKGATSKVWLATRKSTGEQLAVKELNAMADEDTRKMAINELQIANKHAAHAEHLVRFVDAYFDNDKICIAMEFADGVRPRRALARTPVAPAPAAPLRRGGWRRREWDGRLRSSPPPVARRARSKM